MESFSIVTDEAALERVLARVRSFDWDGLPAIGGWEAGIDLSFLQRICEHWVTRYSWSDAVVRMGRHAQFVTSIGGQTVHLIHERPEVSADDNLPVLLLNGWPGTCYEFGDVVDTLRDAGLEVVVPSLPGYGFSSPLAAPVSPREVGHLFHRLMVEELGHEKFVVHGMDWGARIAGWMAIDHADACVAAHIGMMAGRSDNARARSDEEKDWQRRFLAGWNDHNGYHRIQSTRPQTLGVGLSDSPVGVAAWILEKYVAWSLLSTTADGRPDVWSTYDEDTLLDVVMLYLMTGTFVTSTWMYYGSLRDPANYPGDGVAVPVGVAAFPDPVALVPPRSWAEQTYNVVRWDPMTRGGHFPGLEVPELLAGSLLGFLAEPSVRSSID